MAAASLAAWLEEADFPVIEETRCETEQAVSDGETRGNSIQLLKEEPVLSGKSGTLTAKDILQSYGQRFAGAHLPGELQRLRDQAFSCTKVCGGGADEAIFVNIKELNVQQQLREVSLMEDFNKESKTSNGDDDVLLCQHCHLPVGDVRYADDDVEGAVVHGECKAQLVLRNLREKEEDHQKKEDAQKKSRRGKYDIGWQVDRIPGNVGAATKLGGCAVKQGMCCLVLQKKSASISIAATFEPAASVNLEYLSIALQVRRDWGREPIFSLDPVDPKNPNSKLAKQYGPSWLAGTSVGELLFQADYYLKELSMGEHKQPVIGMKSAFDYSVEEGHKQEWSAREWFVVKQAEVHLSNDVLIPYCKMGVEAREQIFNDKEGCLEDALVTRQDHPLVKYAEVFSEKFDVIAERRSVIHNLRELAKASIIAKYLLDDKIKLDETWFNLAAKLTTPCCEQVPQLWNERSYSQVQMQDGEIVGAENGLDKLTHQVYGGVKFGLDRFNFNAPKARGMLTASSQSSLATMPLRRLTPPTPASPAPTMTASRRGVHELVLSTPPNLNMFNFSASVRVDPSLLKINVPAAMHMTPAIQRLTSVAAEAGLRGVDLDLNKFDLSAPIVHDKNESRVDTWAGDCHSLDACTAVGSAFWSNIRSDSNSVFKDADKSLLRDLFNPYLSDRRDEGDRFVPPDNCPLYVQQLRKSVTEEASVRQKRKDHFLSNEFDMHNAGPLFPSSWTSSFGITGKQIPEKMTEKPLQHVNQQNARLECKPDLAKIEVMLKFTSPVFDRLTEEGLRFRIYRLRNIEVRTIQEPLEKEIIGMICSTQLPADLHSPVDHSQELNVDEYEGGLVKEQRQTQRRRGQFTYLCQSVLAGNV